MSLSRVRPIGRVVLSMVLLVGCASSGGQSEGAGRAIETGSGPGYETMQIVVRNDLPSGAASSIQVVSTTGERTLLGAVPPLETQTFNVRLNGDWSYRLVAESVGGRRVSSQLFTVSPGGQVSWRLPDNFLAGP
jgi:hypothetical protein